MFFLWTVYSNFVIKCSFLFDIGKTCHLNVKVSIMYVRLSHKYNLIRTKISCPVYNLKNYSLFSWYKYCSFIFKYLFLVLKFRKRGVLRGGSRGGARAPPLKLEKICFFCVKSWFFTQNTPKIFAPHPLGTFFLSAPPLAWNPGSAPGSDYHFGWR